MTWSHPGFGLRCCAGSRGLEQGEPAQMRPRASVVRSLKPTMQSCSSRSSSTLCRGLPAPCTLRCARKRRGRRPGAARCRRCRADVPRRSRRAVAAGSWGFLGGALAIDREVPDCVDDEQARHGIDLELVVQAGLGEGASQGGDERTAAVVNSTRWPCSRWPRPASAPGLPDRDLEPFAQRVHHRDPDGVQATGHLVG